MHVITTWDHVINNFLMYLTLVIFHDCASTVGALAIEVNGECHVPLARVCIYAVYGVHADWHRSLLARSMLLNAQDMCIAVTDDAVTGPTWQI